MCRGPFFWGHYYANSAPKSRDSPLGVGCTASFNGSVTGSMNFWSDNGYLGYDVKIQNLPKKGGPYSYHIEEKALYQDDLCIGNNNILDPYNGCFSASVYSEYPVGDLSGKYGRLRGPNVTLHNVDKYLSLNPNNTAYIGNLSVSIKDDKQRSIACANLWQNDASQFEQYSDVGRIAISLGAWIPMAAGIVLFL